MRGQQAAASQADREELASCVTYAPYPVNRDIMGDPKPRKIFTFRDTESTRVAAPAGRLVTSKYGR